MPAPDPAQPAGRTSREASGGIVELTVLMPCRNEEHTVAGCVRQAAAFLTRRGIDGEVLVADNGSTDLSAVSASAAGARVVPIAEPGYGSALLGGIAAARGQYVIMGDADGSYDFAALEPFVEHLRDGADLVMGNRFQGGIASGAMKPLHRYLGNPVLSFIGRLFFGNRVGDFHCGLRAFRRDAILSLGLRTTGMEFASEMVVCATLAGQRIDEVPTTLSPAGRDHPPHLRSWRDGWRHLRFLLMFSPRWLFLIPGLILLTVGIAAGAAVTPAPLRVAGITFDVSTLAVAAAMVVIGFQSVMFAAFTHVYAAAEGFLPTGARLRKLCQSWTVERGLAAGGVLGLAGLTGLAFAVVRWQGVGFGNVNYETMLRVIIPSVTALMLSCQLILGIFFLSILGIHHRGTPYVRGQPDGERAALDGRPAVPGEGRLAQPAPPVNGQGSQLRAAGRE